MPSVVWVFPLWTLCEPLASADYCSRESALSNEPFSLAQISQVNRLFGIADARSLEVEAALRHGMMNPLVPYAAVPVEPLGTNYFGHFACCWHLRHMGNANSQSGDEIRQTEIAANHGCQGFRRTGSSIQLADQLTYGRKPGSLQKVGDCIDEDPFCGIGGVD